MTETQHHTSTLLAEHQLGALQAFDDNYIWTLSLNNTALVVDPGDGQVVEQWLEQTGLRLTDILITHHHEDHQGGLEHLLTVCERLHHAKPTVWGPTDERCRHIDQRLEDGAAFEVLEQGMQVQTLHVPGHTLGHIAFVVRQVSTPAEPAFAPPMLFCGDTLFASGCGRMFEGQPEQMWPSLYRLSELEENTLVCCAHEYTLANLKFARAADPNNIALQQRQQHCISLREAGQSTLPSTIGLEKQVNPFLRCHLETMDEQLNGQRQAAGQAPIVSEASPEAATDPLSATAIQRFATLRAWKDGFR